MCIHLNLMIFTKIIRGFISALPQQWAEKLHKSERSFSRFFRQQTGMAFSQWRQQVCLLNSLTQILSGHSITAVAFDLGYNSASSFSTMFKKQMGQSPSDFVRNAP
ncbi:helix-turn-helix domain-containing protein [Proteus mirabilis]|uniref:helix-turn-helix domain-containing protein n=1 Tax=Proteus mirabilis TaxID=584 RepID=UPI001F165F67|nr:helix-turn-helix domain-containing protein [Proteus mirabilis]